MANCPCQFVLNDSELTFALFNFTYTQDELGVVVDFVYPDGTEFVSADVSSGAYDDSTKKWTFDYERTLDSAGAVIPDTLSIVLRVTDEVAFSLSTREVDGTINVGSLSGGDTDGSNNSKAIGIEGLVTCADIGECVANILNLFPSGYKWLSGEVIHLQDLDFHVTASTYMIDGVIYAAPATDITLAAADPADPRFDVIIGDVNGVISAVTGTPAADPAKPTIDTETQIEATFINVPATATTPPDIDTEAIYLENAGAPGEWPGTANISGVAVDFGSVADPFQGTTHVLATLLVNGDVIDFETATPVNVSEIGVLELHIKPTNAWPVPKKLELTFFNGNTQASDTIVLKDGVWGFDASDMTYQTIGIGASAWNFVEPVVDTLRIRVAGGGTDISFELDQIRYQSGVFPSLADLFSLTDGTDTFDVDQGDAVTFTSSDASVVVDLSVPGTVNLTVGPGGNTNWAEDDLTLTANRLHAGGGFNLEVDNLAAWRVDGTSYTLGDGAGANIPPASATGVPLTVIAATGAVNRQTLVNDQILLGGSTGSIDQSPRLTFNSGINTLNFTTGGLSAGIFELEQDGAGANVWQFVISNGGDLQIEPDTVDRNLFIRNVANATLLDFDTADGTLQLNSYTGAITGTNDTAAMFDAAGNVIQSDATDFATWLGSSNFENIYTVDGTIADPLRTVTVGANQLYFTGSNTTNVVEIEGTGVGSFPVLQITGGDSFGLQINTVSAGRTGLVVTGNAGAAALTSNPVTTTGTYPVVTLIRTSQGVAANDIGARLQFQLENGAGASPTFGAVDIIGTDVTAGAEVAAFDVTLLDGTGFTRFLRLAGATGQLTLDSYGAGAITGTATQLLGVDASGNVIEEALGANTNIYNTDGSLTTDRTVTLNGNALVITSGSPVTGVSRVLIERTDDDGDYALNVTGTGAGRTMRVAGDGANDVLFVQGTGSGAAINATSSNGGYCLLGTTTHSSTNTSRSALFVSRGTSGTAIAGIGCHIDFGVENDNNGTASRGSIGVQLSDVTDGAENATLHIELDSGGTLTERLVLRGDSGQVVLSGYGSLTLGGSPTGAALFTSSGEIIEDQDFATKEHSVTVYNLGVDVDTTTGTAGFVVPASLDGFNVVGVRASVHTAGATTGAETLDIDLTRARAGTDVDVLSAPVTIAAGAFSAANGTIDGANDDVLEGDILIPYATNGYITTDATMLVVTIEFRKP